jgi:hypothetical protein
MEDDLPMTPSSSLARVTLPNDLSGSLKYLDDAQLQRLREAVSLEIARRANIALKTAPIAAQATRASQDQPRKNKVGGTAEIPEGKVNLIQASFKAGLKPAAIARTLRISQSLVRRALSSAEGPKR